MAFTTSWLSACCSAIVFATSRSGAPLTGVLNGLPPRVIIAKNQLPSYCRKSIQPLSEVPSRYCAFTLMFAVSASTVISLSSKDSNLSPTSSVIVCWLATCSQYMTSWASIGGNTATGGEVVSTELVGVTDDVVSTASGAPSAWTNG